MNRRTAESNKGTKVKKEEPKTRNRR